MGKADFSGSGEFAAANEGDAGAGMVGGAEGALIDKGFFFAKQAGNRVDFGYF